MSFARRQLTNRRPVKFPARYFVAALCPVIWSATALGETGNLETAQEMQSLCRHVASAPAMANGEVDVKYDGVCWGAFAAIQQISAIRDDLRFCPPPEANRVQFIKIFMKYVDQHPEQLNTIFSIVAVHALSEAFPCSAQQN